MLQELNLKLLERGDFPGLTACAGGYLAEAASVCLDQIGHKSPVFMEVRGSRCARLRLCALVVSAQMRSTHGDLQDATEFGACGIAILLVRAIDGWVVMSRARKSLPRSANRLEEDSGAFRTGYDYLLGRLIAEEQEELARLEVSGTLRGTDGEIRSRVVCKKNQTKQSASTGWPAIVVVVGFKKPVAEIAQ